MTLPLSWNMYIRFNLVSGSGSLFKSRFGVTFQAKANNKPEFIARNVEFKDTSCVASGWLSWRSPCLTERMPNTRTRRIWITCRKSCLCPQAGRIMFWSCMTTAYRSCSTRRCWTKFFKRRRRFPSFSMPFARPRERWMPRTMQTSSFHPEPHRVECTAPTTSVS